VLLNLAYRWFCRLDLQQRVPDHSTFSKNRHGRFRQSDAFRHVFESVLRRCMKEGLVAGEGFAIDASVIKADASPATRWTEGEEPTRAVRKYLQALDAANPSSDDDPPEGSPGGGRHISPTNPEARWTAAPGAPAFYAYSTNYLIDLQAGIIVDVEATPANKTDEVEATRTMIDRIERQEWASAPAPVRVLQHLRIESDGKAVPGEAFDRADVGFAVLDRQRAEVLHRVGFSDLWSVPTTSA
jgi:hypothetical protein